MDDFIRREAAIETLSEFYHHKSEIQHIALREALNRVPAADVVEVVRCKDCIHRPIVVDPKKPYGFGLKGPIIDGAFRDVTCPYLCDDGWYNRMPADDWFCNLGEKNEETAILP